MPHRKIQLVLEMDLTGSMAAVRGEVRHNNCALVGELFDAFPNIEIGVIAVGDDPRPGYMVRHVGLTANHRKLVEFINTVPNAGGGDVDECYEKGLNVARGFEWAPGADKVLVMIGDAYPHSTGHPKNPEGLDWRTEARALAEEGVTLYSVQCLAHYGDRSAQRFWSELARLGGGLHLTLEQFRHVRNLLLGIGHRTIGHEDLMAFTERLERDGSISVGLRRSFDQMLGRKPSSVKRRDGRVPVDGSRFQVLTCTAGDRQDVRDFAVEKGLIPSLDRFAAEVKGRIFYAHTERTELLRPNHHVVIQDLNTDEFFSGASAREWLGIPYGSSGNLNPDPLGPDYRVWVQSKSMNRKLAPGQEVMVEMTEMAAVV